MKKYISHTLISITAAALLTACGTSVSSTDVEALSASVTELSAITVKGTPVDENSTLLAIAKANDTQDLLVVPTSTKISFVGSESNDSENNITSYVWTDMDDIVLSDEADFNRTFWFPGVYEKTLTVTNDQNESAFDRICLLVGIDVEDIPLIAKAGLDQNVTEDDNVTLAGRAVCRDTNLTYAWSIDDIVLDTNTTFTTSALPVGDHFLTFTVTDENNMTAWDSVTVTVNPK